MVRDDRVQEPGGAERAEPSAGALEARRSKRPSKQSGAMNPEHLRALLAIVDTGTFEAAARVLHVTPSAVSQRIKALESGLGRLVVRRTVPCRPTEAGQVLVRMALQWDLLEADARAELDSATAGRAELPVVVNADSLATWFVPVLRTVAGWGDTALRLHVEDQDHSAALLRSGEVVGAVTSDPVATQGCRIRPLGAMRYVPMATAALRDAFTGRGGIDWASMPVVRFNAKDDLQHAFLARRGVPGGSRAGGAGGATDGGGAEGSGGRGGSSGGERHGGDGPPVHVVPSSQGFLAAVVAGLGWGMVPVAQRAEAGRALVPLAGDEHVEVPLYWQAWRLQSPRIERFGEAVAAAARAGLR